jgi:hypothetical protein
MPIRTTFRREDKLVLVEGQGAVTLDDAMRCIRMIDAQGAHQHRKLLDFRRVTTQVPDLVGQTLLDLVRSREALGASGAVALVVGGDATHRALAEQAAKGAPAERPIAVFDDIDKALRWIETWRG